MDKELKEMQYDTALVYTAGVLMALGITPALTLQGRLRQIDQYIAGLLDAMSSPCPHLRSEGGSTWCDYPGAEPDDYLETK